MDRFYSCQSTPSFGKKCEVIVRVPIRTVSINVFRKEHKYVCASEVRDENCEKGFVDKFMSVFRPKTPPGMRRVVKKRLVGKWALTLYKKERVFVSTK